MITSLTADFHHAFHTQNMHFTNIVSFTTDTHSPSHTHTHLRNPISSTPSVTEQSSASLTKDILVTLLTNSDAWEMTAHSANQHMRTHLPSPSIHNLFLYLQVYLPPSFPCLTHVTSSHKTSAAKLVCLGLVTMHKRMMLYDIIPQTHISKMLATYISALIITTHLWHTRKKPWREVMSSLGGKNATICTLAHNTIAYSCANLSSFFFYEQSRQHPSHGRYRGNRFRPHWGVNTRPARIKLSGYTPTGAK